jgi:tRNA pseudouridine13 synthase
VRIKVVPGDFVVEERADLQLVVQGPWAVYAVRKVGLTTLETQTRLAAELKLSRQQVIFPALKDKESVSVQYASLPAGAPEAIAGEGWRAQRLGQRLRPLAASDLRGNAFVLIVRDLDAAEATHLGRRLGEMARCGLPNYYDEQRFGSLSISDGFIGKAILQRDAEKALRLYLAVPFAGDPQPVRAFKRRAAELWPAWPELFAAAPRPSNFRSVLTYLVGHPQDYRAALNLIPQRLLALYLAAYQSWLWNRIAGQVLGQFYAQHGLEALAVQIAGQWLPAHGEASPEVLAALRDLRLALPSHQALYPVEVLPTVQQTLAGEGLDLTDLKARILSKAYLPKGMRPLLLQPTDMQVVEQGVDERFPGKAKLRVCFTLPRGSYATLVLSLAAMDGPSLAS